MRGVAPSDCFGAAGPSQVCSLERETRGIPKGRLAGPVVRRDEGSSAAEHGRGDREAGAPSGLPSLEIGPPEGRRQSAGSRSSFGSEIEIRGGSTSKAGFLKPGKYSHLAGHAVLLSDN